MKHLPMFRVEIMRTDRSTAGYYVAAVDDQAARAAAIALDNQLYGKSMREDEVLPDVAYCSVTFAQHVYIATAAKEANP